MVTYLKEKHSRFEAILEEQGQLAENQMEEADQMFRPSNPEYRAKAELESEAQKALSELQETEEVKTAITNYMDAIHGRWRLFHKLFYQYAVKEILSSSREAEEPKAP